MYISNKISFVTALLVLSVASSNSGATQSSVYTTSYTSLTRCPTTDRHTFKREKNISEQCSAKEGFHIFIEGDTEETLKFVLEKNFIKLIADDPHSRHIRISRKSGGDKLINGEITGQRVTWIYKKNQLVGIVLKRLLNAAKQYEAFRLVNNSYFCHVGGDLDEGSAKKLLENGNGCNS